MTHSRVSPGDFRRLGPVNWLITRVVARAIRVPDAHLFSTLARTGGLFRAWLYYSARMMPFGVLTRWQTEVVILRVATLRDCGYELDHHIRLGRRAGIDAATLAKITTGPTADWAPRERALLTAVDELVTTRDIGDDGWTELAAHLSERELIAVVMLVGQYDSLATTIGTLRIPRDDFGSPSPASSSPSLRSPSSTSPSLRSPGSRR
ncbi:alkylhydroperoxidase AhpD family core domain-containing protein [Williamsia sterculiae]|uniref:Alkylhydroperoxidase AhpD family core domain-containing protein n=1 Tax=Williamsia sterculiae TaxID=1344003 RepID=A0A1N7EXU9_9NOCA|nr:alkylhydroperoxidase AhpD family core domain-containing protein [Williamsia sterculiae]